MNLNPNLNTNLHPTPYTPHPTLYPLPLTPYTLARTAIGDPGRGEKNRKMRLGADDPDGKLGPFEEVAHFHAPVMFEELRRLGFRV